MPKQKVHKGLAKRVKVTAKGKILYKKPFSGHLMSGKSGQRCRILRKKTTMLPVMAKKALILLCAE